MDFINIPIVPVMNIPINHKIPLILVVFLVTETIKDSLPLPKTTIL